MKKWNLIEQTAGPGGDILALFEHDGAYVIRVNGAELMSTRRHYSEEMLAQLACAHLRVPAKDKRNPPRVLIGGLGFGFTLKAALEVLPESAKVEVVELSEAVVRWNKDPSLPLAGAALADPRTKLHVGDVAQALARGAGTFDAIMLDTDNGPAALTQEDNDKLYREIGVQQAVAALRPGGCIAYWSATDDQPFAKLLARSGVDVETHKVRAVATSGGKHTIFTGKRR